MSDDMVEVVIDSIRVSLMSQQRIVILREVDAERYLPIWIGPYEAESITIALQEVEVARPLTHDLLRNVFRDLNAQVVRVEVTSLRNEVYYGNIVAEVNDSEFNVDSRPSDALALAGRTNVPILISHEVMDSSCIVPEENLDEETPAGEDAAGEEVQEERLSVFEDFLDNIELGPKKDDDEEEEQK